MSELHKDAYYWGFSQHNSIIVTDMSQRSRISIQKSQLLGIACLFLLHCQPAGTFTPFAIDEFQASLSELQTYFHIPGMAIKVQKQGKTICEAYQGFANIETNTPMDSLTRVPIASITKVFTGIMVMKLVESGKLSLEDPISTYVPDLGIPDSIQVRHILSHTSQGPVGKHFYYSGRFGLLTPIIEQASGQSFADYFQQEVQKPLGLTYTFLLNDSTEVQALGGVFAQPYVYDSEVQAGFIEYGYSASAGVVSTANDLSILANALLNNPVLLTASSRQQMLQPFRKNLPYGLGIFSQNLHGTQIVWAYGQYDCYSSLLLMVPEQKLSLVLLANNNLLSDLARLIYGNAGSSLFVQTFMEHFVWTQTDIPAPVQSAINRDQQLAQALAASFMSRYDSSFHSVSSNLLDTVFRAHPNYQEYGDLSLLHTVSFLKDVAYYREMEPFTRFDPVIKELGKTLLDQDPNNPYANVYLGNFHSRGPKPELARPYFSRIVNTPNFSFNWYTSEAQNWLKENP